MISAEEEEIGMQQVTTAAAISNHQPDFSDTTIGIDLGDRWSRYCVLDRSGTIIEEGRVRTNEPAFRQRFGVRRRARIVMEAGTHSPWVSRLLEELGHQVMVANARKVRLIYESDRKNDKLDAQMLARLGRMDVSLLCPVRHRSAETQADLAIVRSRNALVAARIQLVNSVRGMVKAVGGRLPKSTTAAFGHSALPQVPEALKSAVTPLLTSIRALTEQIRRYDVEIEQLADKKYPETRLLRQVKGVGPLIVLTYVLTIEDPTRFRRSREVGSFLGLRPKQRESGDSAPQLGITKGGNNHLRWLLVQASQYTLSRLTRTVVCDSGDWNSQCVEARTRKSERWSRWLANWRYCCIGCGRLAKFTTRYTESMLKQRERFERE